MANMQKIVDELAHGLRSSRPDSTGTEELRQWETDVRAVQVCLTGIFGWHFQWAAFSLSVRAPKEEGP